MEDRRRWDIDTRLVGIADAQPVARDIQRLWEICAQPGWVTEDADAHVGFHLRSACESPSSPWRWVHGSQGDDGVYVVDLEHTRSTNEDVWPDAIVLLSTMAEHSFHVRRVDERTIDCVTGMLSGDGDFATHGHTVRLRIARSSQPR